MSLVYDLDNYAYRYMENLELQLANMKKLLNKVRGLSYGFVVS